MNDPADAALAPLRIGTQDGLRADILPFGARLAALWVPGREGPINVVLGYPDPRSFEDDPFFLGATVGRTSGRIAGARFDLQGKTYHLTANEGLHHLHGGPRGFHALPWKVHAHDKGPRSRVVLGLASPDGDEGYPGTLEATAVFEIDGDALLIELTARADASTPVSLTNHAYYNLSGDPGRNVGDHRLTLPSEQILELDAAHIPTGRRLDVSGTPFDFRTPTRIDARSGNDSEQLRLAGGYDHTYLCEPGARWDACLAHEGSGLEMRLSANQPGIQVYAGHYLYTRSDARFGPGCGLCLEPQQLPNAINQPEFPSPLLAPGETFRNVTRIAFTRIR